MKLLLALIITIMPTCLMASERSKVEMDAIATEVLGGTTTTTVINGMTIMPTVGIVATASELLGETYTAEPFYVYARIDSPIGYVFVSADDQLPEILAFSANEPFYKDDLPDALKYILRGKAKAAEYIASGKARRKAPMRKIGYTPVAPLLGDIAFGQRTPFNDLCPLSGTTRTLTGCVSTAMSQVMAYYEYPTKMIGEYISYTTPGGLPVNWDCASTTFDWENTLHAYSTLIEDFSGTISVNTASPLILMDITLYESHPQYLTVSGLANVALPAQSLGKCFVQTLLADDEGNFIRPIGTTREFDAFSSGSVWNFSGIRHTIPADIPDGTYRLYLGLSVDGEEDWKVIPKGAELAYGTSTSEFYIEVEKSGNNYTLLGQSFTCGYSATNAKAVATLHAATGASVSMDYGTGNSSASSTNAAIALVNNMGYDDALIFINPNFFDEEGWTQAVIDELNQSRPIFCSGTTSTNLGHAFIIDGFKYSGDDIMFHVNWGWTGSSNGYYYLNNLTPQEAGDGGIEENYSYKLSLMTNIKPADTKDDGITMGAEDIEIGSTTVNAGSKLNISTTKLTNISTRTFNGSIDIYLADADGIEYPVDKYMYISNLEFGWFYTSLSNTYTIPVSVPDGTYTLILKSKTDEGVEKKVIAPEYPELTVVNHALGAVNENSTSITASGAYTTVSVTRTIDKDVWSTIVLPFSMSEAQVLSAFGPEVKIVEFTGSDVTEEGGEVKQININFANKASKSIEANHPYLIRTTTDITSFDVNGVTVEVSTKPEIVIGGDHFIGNYAAGTLLGEDCLFLSENRFFYSAGKTKINALRAYFDLAHVLTDKSVDADVKFFINDDITPIEEIDIELVGSAYYSLNGIKSERPTSGINIHNGSKVIVR